MSGDRRKPHVGGRYHWPEITGRIQRRLRQRKVRAKELYTDLGMDRWDWSRKIRNKGSRFSVEELGQIADLLDAPPGWPFLDEAAWSNR